MLRALIAIVLAAGVVLAIPAQMRIQQSDRRAGIVQQQHAASAQAKQLVAAGDLDRARQVLIDAWALDRSAMYLRRQLKDVNDAIFLRDARKAHQQHAREQTGGVLAPEDVIP